MMKTKKLASIIKKIIKIKDKNKIYRRSNKFQRKRYGISLISRMILINNSQELHNMKNINNRFHLLTNQKSDNLRKLKILMLIVLLNHQNRR